MKDKVYTRCYYVLTTNIRGIIYFVQKYKKKWVLSGLSDNAFIFRNRETAYDTKKEISHLFKTELNVDHKKNRVMP